MSTPRRIKASELHKVRKELIEKQGGRCALCDRDLTAMEPKNVCVDHCHDNGHIRAALCRNCNGMLGKIENLATRAKATFTRLEWLIRAVDFLSLHKEPQTPYEHPTHRTPEEKRQLRNAKQRAKRRAQKE